MAGTGSGVIVGAIAVAFLAAGPCAARPAVAQEIVAEDAAAARDSLHDLPLITVEPTGPPAPEVAVLLTGDGGWAKIDKEIADSLARHGMTVVALDSRAYLSTRRSPDQTSHDMARIMAHYMAALGKDHVVLIGYSRGADMLPFMASRLPGELLARVRLIALLGPAPNANLKFHLIDLVSNHHRQDDLPTIPEIGKLRGQSVICFYGAEEKETACGSLDSSTAVSYEMPGGHHFDEQYGAIADRILMQLSTPAGG